MEKNSFVENFYKNAGYYCVGLISAIYIASSLILISKTGKTVYEIIGTGFISLVVGSLINGCLRNVGISRGESDERLIEALNRHSSTVEEITPSFDLLDEFCDNENMIAIKKIRMKILAGAGLKYDECFDENGVCKEVDFSNKSKKAKQVYEKAVKLKIKELTPDTLTNDGNNNSNPFDFGKTKSGYNKEKSFGDILVRIFMALIFGYFGVTLVSEINFATLIWNTLQIVMYLTSGIVSMYSTYMWIVNDYRQGIIKKIDYLKKFKLYAENKH